MSCSLQHTGSQPRARGVAASASDLASNLAPVAQGGAGLEAMQKADKRGTILHIFPLQVRLLYLLPLFIRYVSLRCELITAAPSSLPCPWAPPRTVWGAGASLERLLGTCAPKLMDPWIWTARSMDQWTSAGDHHSGWPNLQEKVGRCTLDL